MKKHALAAAMVGMLALAIAPSAFADSARNTDTRDCSDQTMMNDTIALTGSQFLWPPNHKYRSYTITATAANPMESVSFTSTVTNDEFVDGEELNGAGNTTDDASPNPQTGSGTGSATANQSIRSERSGRGDGREYTFTVMATFGGVMGVGGRMCTEQFTVTVPHDQRNHQG
jgi:hypothetical protein